MDPAAVVRAGYDAIGPRYHAWSSAGPVRIAYVARLLAMLAPGSTVLELGCGPGDPATRLLSAAHRVVGVDLSSGQLALARGHAPDALLVQADMTRLSVRPASVDAIASFFALGHLPAAAHAPLLASFGGWLRPGGVLMTTVPVTPEDGMVEQVWLGVPMFFGGIGRAATVAAVESGGLVVESVDHVAEEENGRLVGFDWLVARRPQ
jgi:ubiquinone/menaquinone biosynthesis C-methylase UbiE